MSVFDKENVRDALMRKHWQEKEVQYQAMQVAYERLFRILADMADPERYTEDGMFKIPETGEIVRPHEYALEEVSKHVAIG